jgi:hypothetical protein
MHGLAVVVNRLTAHEADVVATAAKALIEPLPIDSGRFHGDQQTAAAVCDQMFSEGLFKESEAFTARGKGKLAAVDACLGPDTSTVLGLTHIYSDEQEARLLNILFTRFGVSAILFQSHETFLLR